MLLDSEARFEVLPRPALNPFASAVDFEAEERLSGSKFRFQDIGTALSQNLVPSAEAPVLRVAKGQICGGTTQVLYMHIHAYIDIYVYIYIYVYTYSYIHT